MDNSDLPYLLVCRQVSGVDSGGYAFQRLTPTAISAIRPRAPAVTMPTLTRGYYDNPVTLSCHVQSLVPYELRWFRDNKQLGNTLHYRWSLSQINFVVARFAIATRSSADAFEKFSPCFLMKRCLRCWESFAIATVIVARASIAAPYVQRYPSYLAGGANVMCITNISLIWSTRVSPQTASRSVFLNSQFNQFIGIWQLEDWITQSHGRHLQTNRHIDRPRHSICSNKPHLCYACDVA